MVTTARSRHSVSDRSALFRNEITPGNFIFRTREFEQMEMEFFVEPATAKEWHQYWIDNRLQWYIDLSGEPAVVGAPQRQVVTLPDRTVDIEYKFGFMGNYRGELKVRQPN